MFGTTMMLTVGQALDRAQHEGVRVRVLMSGEWFAGRVTNTDSQSLMLEGDDGTTYVMRIDAITCVASTDEEQRPAVPTQPTEARV
jgi:hypothetical protein